jgi:hypothetical protein
MFQPIDIPWDNSIVYVPNAGDIERICSARKQRCEPAPCNPHQANSGQRSNPKRKNKFDFYLSSDDPRFVIHAHK